MVEEGNLFDPARPSLGSELEALRQHLEALSASPDPLDGRAARPAGAPGGGAVPEPSVSGQRGLKPFPLATNPKPGEQGRMGHLP